MMASGRGSMARIIQNSLEARRVFLGHVRRSLSTNVVRKAVANMRAAKHRFESLQKPLGRGCIQMHSTIKTAVHIAGHGTPDGKSRAKQWLQWLDTEKALQAAMMSDASDQAMEFTRFLDSEGVDPARVAVEALHFLSMLRALFFGDGTQPRCWSTFGYTALTQRTLQTPVVWHVGAAPRSIGNAAGVDSDIKDRCLGRMQAWVALARAAVSAEFPNFELAQSFRIFDLSAVRVPQTPADDLSRIARVVGVEAAALTAQWEDMWPRARELADSGNKTAWRQALENVNAHHMTAKAHPTAALRKALVHFLPTA